MTVVGAQVSVSLDGVEEYWIRLNIGKVINLLRHKEYFSILQLIWMFW